MENIEDSVQLLKDQIQTQQKLISIAEDSPLSVASLWSPFCCDWEGKQEHPERNKCLKPMERIAGDLYYCSSCDIKERRSSQLTCLEGHGSEAHLLATGNRFGKSDVGAMLSVAHALGSADPACKMFLENNGLDPNFIQKEAGVVWAVAISFSDALEYLRPKLDRFLPKGTTKKNWGARGRAEAVLPNGGRIVSMSYEMKRKKFQGGEINFGWIDEEDPDPSVFEEMLLRCTDRNGWILITATPLNGLTWTYEKFYEKALEGYTYVHGTGLDNPFIDPRVLRRKVRGMTESMQRARLFGHFTSQSGLIYQNFNPSIHVIKPFEIPKDGKIFRSIDFGVRNPFCCLWFYWDQKGRFGADDAVYVFREYYKTERTVIENGKRILDLSKKDQKVLFTVADSAGKGDRLLLSRELKIPTKPSPKELGLVNMIELVLDRLAIHADSKPRLFFFSSCTNLIKEIKKYRWKDTRSKDEPVKADDHALDALRYAIGFLSRYNKLNKRGRS